MEDVTTLDRLAVGCRAAVTGLFTPEPQRRRMLELGFVPGGEVSAVQENRRGQLVLVLRQDQHLQLRGRGHKAAFHQGGGHLCGTQHRQIP